MKENQTEVKREMKNSLSQIEILVKILALLLIYHICIITPTLDKHLMCFHFLIIVNSASKNTEEDVFLQKHLDPFTFITKSGIPGSCGRLYLSYLKSIHTNSYKYLLLSFPRSLERGFIFPSLFIRNSCHSCLILAIAIGYYEILNQF